MRRPLTARYCAAPPLAPWPTAARLRPIVKVGQTFLSARLVPTQRFVRLPLSSQEKGPGGEVLLPKCRQKNGSCRFYRGNTGGRSTRVNNPCHTASVDIGK